jgi:hypothetical protein
MLLWYSDTWMAAADRPENRSNNHPLAHTLSIKLTLTKRVRALMGGIRALKSISRPWRRGDSP